MIPGWVCLYRYDKKSRCRGCENVIYSAKIRQLKKHVKDYSTRYSGLTRLDLSEESIPIKQILKELRVICKDRTIIGVNLDKDLQYLGLSHNDIPYENRFDLHSVFIDENNQPISLKVLTYVILGKRIQEFDPKYDPMKAHDPIIDSRSTIKIFNLMDKIKPINNSYQWIRDIAEQAIYEGRLQIYAHKKI
jgi:hypothetical protein